LIKRKPRILLVNEASYHATGYSNYGYEVQKRLHATGKYELAELACYGQENDPRKVELPWQYYANEPEPNSPEMDEYRAIKINQFGNWKFNDTCLKFRPDVVWDFRDWWMLEAQERSPFRRFYKWAIMPTVDSAPQNEQWISTFINADAVLTYSDWGRSVLEKEGGGLIKTMGVASPGADTETFCPMDKAEIRKKFGIEPDIFLVGTVMRNQPRKLYPELFRAFAEFLKAAPAEMASKTYLYLHTSYPDQGWSIPLLIKKYGLSRKVLMTYKCRNCAAVFPSFYQDARGVCHSCGMSAAVPPNVRLGVDRETVAKIINFFDVYVQYSNSEGFGMPMVEAAACGIPVFATDYSAMSDVVRKVNGTPLGLSSLAMDFEFGCFRATPDRADFVKKLIKFLSLSPSARREASYKARKGVEANYTWDRTAKVWMSVFDSLTPSLSPDSETWESSPRLHTPKKPPSEFATNEDFVDWAIINILGRPEMLDSYMALRLIRDLTWGMAPDGTGGLYQNEDSMLGNRDHMKDFNESNVIDELTALCENNNKWEKKRWELLQKTS
jgi:glycosyltransferase involved in cell wall biosynthesis